MGTVVEAAEMAEPIVRRKSVEVRNDGTMTAVIDAGQYGQFITDEPVAHGGRGLGPSPLQVVLGAMCGCESVTFNRTAGEMGFTYESVVFAAEFTIDVRGRMGVREVRPHFQTVRVTATVRTAEPAARLAEVVEETERRCPVFNLLVDAGVDVRTTWVREEI